MRIFLALLVLAGGIAAGAYAFYLNQQRAAEDQACLGLATMRLAASSTDPAGRAREMCDVVARMVAAGVTSWRPALEELLTLPSGRRGSPNRR